MKPIGSLTTGLAKALLEQTGEPAGATGSAMLPSLQPLADQPPAWMGSHGAMLNGLTLQWLDTVKRTFALELSALGSDLLHQVIRSIDEDRDKLEALMQPASKASIIKTISGFASMLQVPVPDDAGLDLYIMALARLPQPVFNAARNKLVMTHKWARLPTPADFVEAGAEEQERLETLQLVLMSARRSASRALTALR